MKKLKYTEKVVRFVDYMNLEDFIQDVYNVKDFDFIENEECSNDSEHEFLLTTETELYEYDTRKIAEFRQNDGKMPYYMTYTLLRNAVSMGKLDPATYIVR